MMNEQRIERERARLIAVKPERSKGDLTKRLNHFKTFHLLEWRDYSSRLKIIREERYVMSETREIFETAPLRLAGLRKQTVDELKHFKESNQPNAAAGALKTLATIDVAMTRVAASLGYARKAVEADDELDSFGGEAEPAAGADDGIRPEEMSDDELDSTFQRLVSKTK